MMASNDLIFNPKPVITMGQSKAEFLANTVEVVPTPPESDKATTSPSEPALYSGTKHAATTSSAFESMSRLAAGGQVVLDGQSLDIPSLVAVARFGASSALDRSDSVVGRINDSVDTLTRRLDAGGMVYGVNTGFGGSADVRTKDLKALQKGLVQHQNSAILTDYDMGIASLSGLAASDVQSKAMPTTWARGLMLARLNSIIRGHSAVSMTVIEGILTFLEKGITPMIPKRGSISASGDLMPLSYLAGALQGNPDIYVQMRCDDGSMKVAPSDEALRAIGMTPIVLGAKEGLGLLNGTAASASVASLALYDCNQFALLSQALTAMGVEAMTGTAESFHPFIAAVRPHKGQVEAAANILGFLSGSKLAKNLDENEHTEEEGLAQDRYALRTASQWIGPQLEDLMLANEQVTVELNSTTDNPLVDIASGHVRHGGNFQAASVTSAMEKSRLALQMIAKLLFAQATEILNASLNRGLPPNLCADDPSVSFMGKGIDITMAGYYSEIAYLSNPVSTHVQSAEMHNQAVNSLALISARYTLDVADILAHMCANYLVMVCQALDLRVLQTRFLAQAQAEVEKLSKHALAELLSDPLSEAQPICQAIWERTLKEWDASTTLDLDARAQKTAEAAAATLLQHLRKLSNANLSAPSLFATIDTFTASLASSLHQTYDALRTELFADHLDITPQYLGRGSRELYTFVRRELDIPFHRGIIDDPTFVLKEGQQPSRQKRRTIGSMISKVYMAISEGRVWGAVVRAAGNE